MKNLSFVLFLLAIFSISVFAQDKNEPPPLPVANDEEVIRISSQLVLVDTLVLDKKGNQVTDLTADDFEVYQDGKLQEVTSFTYVDAKKKENETDNSTEKEKPKKSKLPVPPVRVRTEPGRVITFVIDDGNCFTTPEGLTKVKISVKKFIDEQMLPEDRVTIYRTIGGTSLLQSYTSNKDALRRIVNKISWRPRLGCGSDFEYSGYGSSSDGLRSKNETILGNEEQNRVTRASIGVLSFAVDRLKNLPERKTVFFISDGIGIGFNELQTVSDKAIRSSVVIYTLSAKGLTIPGMSNASSATSNTDKVGDQITQEFFSGTGMSYLAETTGGKFIHNKNYLNVEIEKILESEAGYYLLGYQPDDETFKGKGFHKIEIKLKRDDLEISSRKGFYGLADVKTEKKPRTSESPLYQAIAAPLGEEGIDIRLTTLVGNDPQNGNYIRVLFHVSGEDLTFTSEPNGMKKVVLDVVAVTLNEKGEVVEEFNHTYPIRIPPQGFEIVQRNGLDYSADIPIKKPGFYNFRIAIRDAASNRLASSGDFVEIPKIKSNKFIMSGLITTSELERGKPLLPKNRPAQAAFAPVSNFAIPSIRQHQTGSPLVYSYDIYNAKKDKGTNQPNLTKQIRIYKDGQLLIQGKETPLELKDKTDSSHIRDVGYINLNQNVAIGEYVLQIIVSDKVANRTESQWVDFEVVD